MQNWQPYWKSHNKSLTFYVNVFSLFCSLKRQNISLSVCFIQQNVEFFLLISDLEIAILQNGCNLENVPKFICLPKLILILYVHRFQILFENPCTSIFLRHLKLDPRGVYWYITKWMCVFFYSNPKVIFSDPNMSWLHQKHNFTGVFLSYWGHIL